MLRVIILTPILSFSKSLHPNRCILLNHWIFLNPKLITMFEKYSETNTMAIPQKLSSFISLNTLQWNFVSSLGWQIRDRKFIQRYYINLKIFWCLNISNQFVINKEKKERKKRRWYCVNRIKIFDFICCWMQWKTVLISV